MIFLRDSLSVRSFLIAAATRYSGLFLLSLVTRFACAIGQLAKIWIWVSSEVITICIEWVCEYQSTSWILHSLLHRAEETQQGWNSCPRLQFGFQFGLYRVVAPLSFLRSISLTSLFTWILVPFRGSFQNFQWVALSFLHAGLTRAPANPFYFKFHALGRKVCDLFLPSIVLNQKLH